MDAFTKQPEPTIRDYLFLVLPDKHDILWLVVMYAVGIVFMALDFSNQLIDYFLYLWNPFFQLTLGSLYLSYWGWRYGYFGIFHYTGIKNRQKQQLARGEKVEPNLKFFGLLVSVVLIYYGSGVL